MKNIKSNVLRNVEKFAEITTRNFQSMISTSLSRQKAVINPLGVISNQEIFVSILFTGTVYGEYIIAFDEKIVRHILNTLKVGDSQKPLDQMQNEISETLSEILNIIVGECVVDLGQNYQKLTITAPRVYFGRMKYPKIETGQITLNSVHGAITCYLYVDQMKLDIADSYKSALSALTIAHEELQAAMHKLQNQQELLIENEKKNALGTMAAGIAHEINTPLCTIKMLGGQIKSMVQENDMDKDHFLKSLDVIDVTTEKIAKITGSLRVFAKGFNGEPIVAYSINKIIEDALLLCEQNLIDNNILLKYKNTTDSMTVECRPTEIISVLLSLINNSVDALEPSFEKWIEISVENKNDLISIIVTDSGSGINEEIQKKIFDPFFTTKEYGKGMGLGLSVSKGIMTSHFGSLELSQNTPNTCFVLTLPKIHKKPNKAVA